MFIAHMDDVQTKLKKLGMDKESAEGILKRYKEIGLPNWCVGFGAFGLQRVSVPAFCFLDDHLDISLCAKTLTRFSGLLIPRRCLCLKIWLKTLSR